LSYLAGTPAYMSPEQLRGHAVDHRTDIWAFGCVMYEMVAGTPIFPTEWTASTLKANSVSCRCVVDTQLQNAVRQRLLLPMGIERLVRKCLEVDPERRYQSTRELRNDLCSCQEGNSLPTAIAIRRLATHSWFIAVSSVALLVIIFFLSVSYFK